MFEKIIKEIGKMRKTKCECGTISNFEEVAKGYNQYDKKNRPIIESIIRCNNCDRLYRESEYDKLPKILANDG